jgi:hypothetical protein
VAVEVVLMSEPEPTPTEPDKYDEAIAFLTANPGRIYDAWASPAYMRGGCLFAWVGVHGYNGTNAGCLTQVHSGYRVGCTEELTKAIREDMRIPMGVRDVTADSLPVFAEWQRRLDKELNRL